MKGTNFFLSANGIGKEFGFGESTRLFVQLGTGFLIRLEPLDGELFGEGEPVLGEVTHGANVDEAYCRR